jgi:ArsR family transcriptional regulator
MRTESTRKRASRDSCDVTFIHQDRVKEARRGLKDEGTTSGMAETFKALGDPTRLKIVLALSREELCVCDLAALLGMTESAVSHQLRLLKTLRLVKYRRGGKMAYYSVDDEHIEDIIVIAGRHVAERG